MTDQTIIDDAKAAGLSFLGVKSSDRWKALFDFVAIREARAKADASKQAQGEAVGYVWLNEPNGSLVFSNLNEIKPVGSKNVYLAPNSHPFKGI